MRKSTAFWRENRMIILLAVLIAALLLLLVFPLPVRVRYEGTAVEYSLTSPDIAISHEVSIDGFYDSNILRKDQFRGTFFISGVERLTETPDNAHFYFDPEYRYFPDFLNAYGEPRSSEISQLLFDKDFQRLAVQFDGTSTFMVIGAANREDAVSQYSRLLEEKRWK